ncbi:DNA ligase 3 [Nilaparvata lugens]|uniref:DNA ligase 3 n=1 Tax=Nilaparvata lugens TaxID=108931 RepID=UPI00193E9553|nr:DNA ligase 3 [Nilaparvata lugens]
MTDAEDEKPFYIDRAKTGRSSCQKCKQKIDATSLRLAKTVFNPFGDGKMKQWHHVECMFEKFKKQRASTVKIEHPDDIGNWDNISDEDKEEIFGYLPDSARIPKTPKKVDTSNQKTSPKKTQSPISSSAQLSAVSSQAPAEASKKASKDDLFREFRRLCADIANASSYLAKTARVKEQFTKGAQGDGFKGDIILWCRLLLPGFIKRVYNLRSKQLIKLFSRLFKQNYDEMLVDLEKGDVAETTRIFFEKSSVCIPSKKSLLTLQEVDEFLEDLTKLTKEDDQLAHFKSIAGSCTSNDLKMIVRLVNHDLRINAGAKHILEGVHPDAYQAFQASRDLPSVLNRLLNVQPQTTCSSQQPNTKDASAISISVMTPVLPMLAEACKSVEQAMKKCPDGMYSEIKYDGERVQVHKHGSEFRYYSRSLKPVLPHKVNHFKDYIPKAFPLGNDLILDSEILLIDIETSKPLPFGSLGKHKKNEFKDACVCLFVFDCLYYNNQSLMKKPLKERKRILRENMKEIPNRIVFSEMEEISEPKDLEKMMTKVFRLGLEGLVLKNVMGIYEPGKRHWLKVKKDYLFGGAMADSADLVVLGAWYGTGNKGGMMSVFLMGCYDPRMKRWVTVTKVHGGHDDKTLESLQTELDMVKISKDQTKVPDWLNCTKTMVPDFVARDPKAQPVWEIQGAEFTQHEVHTAAGISIRFPRVTRIRSDKDWQTATSLPELKVLFKKSKENSDFTLLGKQRSPSPSTSSAVKKPLPPSPTSSSCSPAKRRKQEVSDDEDIPPRDIERGRKKRKPDSEPSEKEKIMRFNRIKKPLPDVFVGVKLHVSETASIEDRRLLERYFVAFGGKLVNGSLERATHTVVSEEGEGEDCNDISGQPIVVDWLWDSIKLKKLQNVSLYKPSWVS